MSVDTKDKTEAAPKPDEVTFTIDGIEVSVPKGTLVIRAAERMGINIPRFCDHPLLDPAGACRQCLVDVPDGGNGRPMKPQTSCTLAAMPGMKVETHLTNENVAKHQAGMLEFLLVNHPLDCPICDKGGECPLQNQALSHGHSESRYDGVKRTYPKPIPISSLVLLDRERCVLCQRCTRFSAQISGDDFISLAERGAVSQIATDGGPDYNSYFSGNVIQICPVGALTSTDYRFQARPFDLVSTTVTCENCAAGCELRADHRHGTVRRRLAGNLPEVNEEWNCDKGRFGFRYALGEDRLTTPLVRRDGKLEPASWPEAIDAAVEGLQQAGGVGVLPGGRLSLETSYAYSRFARQVLGTNNVDFRSRPFGVDEENFLAARVVGRGVDESVTYADLESAKRVVLIGLEPQDESPMIFLRLRKAWRKKKVEVSTVGAMLSSGSKKMGARLIEAVPGSETQVIARLADEVPLDADTVILAGERLGLTPGALAGVAKLADQTGARLAWVPRRAGELGAIEAGCLPTLLPGGRPVADAAARVDVAAEWGVESLPSEAGFDADAILAGAADGSIGALVTGAVELADFADPAAARAAVDKAGFVVAIEQRYSEIVDRADVVFPVAAIEQQHGTFINWEHRVRPFDRVNRQVTNPMTDVRVLSALADALGRPLGMRKIKQAAESLESLGAWQGARVELADVATSAAPVAGDGLVVASWRMLLDSRSVDHADGLEASAPQPVVRMSRATADRAGIASDATDAVLQGKLGEVVLPLEITDMADDVCWIPASVGVLLGRSPIAKPGSRMNVSGRKTTPARPNAPLPDPAPGVATPAKDPITSNEPNSAYDVDGVDSHGGAR